MIKNVKVSVGKQSRFPRSKKKRIRKKWEKNMKNWSWNEIKGVQLFAMQGRIILPGSVDHGDTVKVNYECEVEHN